MQKFKPGQFRKLINGNLQSVLTEFSPDQLVNLAREDGSINNVLCGVCQECFGLFGEQAQFNPKLILYYLNGESEDVQSEVITLDVNDDDRNYLLLSFCNYLNAHYPHLDIVACFNNYQHQVKTYLELFNCRTYDDRLITPSKGRNRTLIFPNVNGVYYVPKVNKLEFYRRFFNDRYALEKRKDQHAVYKLL